MADGCAFGNGVCIFGIEITCWSVLALGDDHSVFAVMLSVPSIGGLEQLRTDAFAAAIGIDGDQPDLTD